MIVPFDLAIFSSSKIRVRILNLLNQSVEGVVSVEMLTNFCRIEPRTIYPEIFNIETFENTDQPAAWSLSACDRTMWWMK